MQNWHYIILETYLNNTALRGFLKTIKIRIMTIIKIDDNKEDKIVVIKKSGYILLKQKDWDGKVLNFTIDDNQISALITALQSMKGEVIQETKEKHGER